MCSLLQQFSSKRFWSLVFAASLLMGSATAQRRGGERHENAFRFRFVGPAIGNRVAAIAGISGDPSTYYAGAASGGVWKTTDGGNRWQPIFDDQPVAAIGALAVAPSDRSTVWAGTGEPWAIRDSDLIGNGVYKSTDAGKTWEHMGLDDTGRIARIIIHPTDPNLVFVCAEGRLTGPQQERGVYRTTDGGQHWDHVLFPDENTGCSGLAMDRQNPRTLFAGTWQVVMHTYGEFSGGPGSGVYVSRDGGTKWERIEGHGLPHSPVGKIDVALAASDSNRVYALIQTADQGSVWRSDDTGQNWQVVNWDRSLIGRAGYYIRLEVSPSNENEVLISSSSFHRSLDGGHTFETLPWGGDNHDIWIDPENADRFVISNDGGLLITQLHGRGFQHVTLPIGQMYHVAVDNQIPYYVYGNMQDDGTMRGPSTSSPGFGFGNATEAGWDHRLGGCESGFTLPDLTDPDIVWATCYGNEVTRYDARIKEARSVSPWRHTLDSPPNDSKYRCHWTPPLAIDPFDHNTVYYGCQVIFKTSNAGQSWSVISPDLSTQDPTRIVSSGGIVGDNLGQFYGEVAFAIAPSTIRKGLIWAGTNDGKIWYTNNGGAEWHDVSKNVGMPAWGTITSIQPSFFDPAVAYVSIDYHLMDNRDPFIYETTNFGQSWTLISGGIPKSPLSYVRVVAEDPNKKGLLFAGTGNALYYSSDEGAHWTNLQEGLPHSAVSWAVVQKNFHDLVVSTYGRGIYILDDISPLEQQKAEDNDSAPIKLFANRPAYRFSHNPEAFIDYQLRSSPKAAVLIDILDASGTLVRHLESHAHAGLNRSVWDLHYEGPHVVRLRTAAPDNPHIWEEPRFQGKDQRPITHWGMAPEQPGPLAAPGHYTIKLSVDGQSVTRALDLIRDPRIPTSDQDIERSVRLQLRIRDDVSKTADMINSIEWSRRQLADIEKMSADLKKKELEKSVQEMDQKMQSVEYKLVSKSLTDSDDKYYIENYRIYFNLLWLNGEIGPGAGDVAGGNDFGPTDTEMALLDEIEGELAPVEAEYRELMEKHLPAFNRAMIESGSAPVVAVEASPAAGEKSVETDSRQVTRNY